VEVGRLPGYDHPEQLICTRAVASLSVSLCPAAQGWATLVFSSGRQGVTCRVRREAARKEAIIRLCGQPSGSILCGDGS
jgi:hypothetical protein